MKTTEFVFNCPKKVTVDRIFEGVQDPVIVSSESGIYGKRYENDNKITLFFAHGYRTSFTSKYSAEVREKENRTYIKGQWKAPVFAIGIIVLWYLFIACVIVREILACEMPIFGAVLLIWFIIAMGVGLSIIFIFCEKTQRQKVYEYIKNVENEFKFSNERDHY